MTPAYDPATGMPNTEMNPDYDPNIEGPAMMSDMRDFQTDIIGTMMDYGGEEAMETMAYICWAWWNMCWVDRHNII